MRSDYELGANLRREIAQSLAKGFDLDQRRVEALVGDLLTNDQQVLASAVKHVAMEPAVIRSIKDEDSRLADLTLASLLQDVEVIYSPAVCARTAEVARGLLGITTSQVGKQNISNASSKINKKTPNLSPANPGTDNSKTLLNDQRQSMIMFMGGSIVGLLIMAGIGAMIGLATLRNQSGTATTATTKSTPSAPPAQQITASSNDSQSQIQSKAPSASIEEPKKGNEIDDIADEIFWRKHPEMYGKKLSSADGALAAEWTQIRRCDAVVDHAFYQIYPSMKGQTIDPNNSEMVATWNQIRAGITSCQ
jgi:hypothetical protein